MVYDMHFDCKNKALAKLEEINKVYKLKYNIKN